MDLKMKTIIFFLRRRLVKMSKQETIELMNNHIRKMYKTIPEEKVSETAEAYPLFQQQRMEIREELYDEDEENEN